MVAAALSPLVVLAGPTASGKSSLAIQLALACNGEVVSCDSVSVYRGMEIGAAKPTPAERALVPHHLLDVADPDQPCTAGEYSRLAREALASIRARGRLPIVAGGTGLYLRALLEGLFPAPPVDPALRERLRRIAAEQGASWLHRILQRLDPAAADAIHANDVPKAVRAIEVSLAARQPLTRQWQQGRDALVGYRTLHLGLNPPRALLYQRINQRAAAMFDQGLLEETAGLIDRYGAECRALTSLSYAQAAAVLRGELTREQAIAHAQQGHRNYAKRQLTWFRREPAMHWLEGFGTDPHVLQAALGLVAGHLQQP
ncbi:MAG: tRNA (adenosine(37)-N6)-dimethylallyltransferase MiaA [Acidobacteriota bacterium]|nr:tRNA (adenosine(37)-N6)-dimethylallyltransferase MiaA [Acidobacteriota bacterium]